MTCIICKSSKSTLLYAKAFGQIRKCAGCGLVFTTDLTGDNPIDCNYDEKYYRNTDNYNEVGYLDYFGAEKQQRQAVAGMFVTFLEHFTKAPGRLLDVGCGGGYFAKAAVESGWDVEAIDISEFVIKKAQSLCSATFFRSLLTDLPVDEHRSRYNAVTMFDVIEHVPNPIEYLSLARTFLKNNGRLFVVTPMYGGRLSAQQGSEYIQFKRDHIFHFSTDTLAMTCRQAGFTDMNILLFNDLLEIMTNISSDVINKYQYEREHIFAVCAR